MSRPRLTAATIGLTGVTVLILTGCAGHSSSPPATDTNPAAPITSTATSPHSEASSIQSTQPQVEVNPAGDIPDDQAFVTFPGTGYRVDVPEGWSRSTTTTGVTFTDKYNTITIIDTAMPAAPTTASAQATEVPAIRAASAGFVAGSVTTVKRTAGTAVLITYHAYSAVNPVTNKVANQAVERYEFWRNGHEIALVLAAPVGSDNVDPWLRVTNSFAWTGA